MNRMPSAAARLPEDRRPPAPATASPGSYLAIHVLLIPALLGALAWMLESGPLDMAIARLFVDPATRTFAWRESGWLEIVGHQAARGLPIIVAGVALAGALVAGAVPRWRRWRRPLLLVGTAIVVGPLVVNLLRSYTAQHCPSSLQAFGGFVAPAPGRSFWAASARSGGRCLPSGHAAGGYALFSLYFAGWAARRPAWRWTGLAIATVAGLAFSAVRLAQGAHFASATVWSAAVDWEVCALLFAPLLCRRSRPA